MHFPWLKILPNSNPWRAHLLRRAIFYLDFTTISPSEWFKGGLKMASIKVIFVIVVIITAEWWLIQVPVLFVLFSLLSDSSAGITVSFTYCIRLLFRITFSSTCIGYVTHLSLLPVVTFSLLFCCSLLYPDHSLFGTGFVWHHNTLTASPLLLIRRRASESESITSSERLYVYFFSLLFSCISIFSSPDDSLSLSLPFNRKRERICLNLETSGSVNKWCVSVTTGALVDSYVGAAAGAAKHNHSRSFFASEGLRIRNREERTGRKGGMDRKSQEQTEGRTLYTNTQWENEENEWGIEEQNDPYLI